MVHILLGNVTLQYDWDGVTYDTVTLPGPVCYADCCASLVAARTPVYIMLYDDEPNVVAYFSLEPEYNAHDNVPWAVFFFFLALAALGCAWLPKLRKTFRVEPPEQL